MQLYAYVDAGGIPIEITTNQRASTPDIVPDGVDPHVSMRVGGVWGPRPVVATPSVSGVVVTFSGLPAGTQVEIVDVGSGAVVSTTSVTGGHVATLASPGFYQVEAYPPLPWIGWSGRISC